jgi:hypothetical protein
MDSPMSCTPNSKDALFISLSDDIPYEELVSLKSVVQALEKQNCKLCDKLKGLQDGQRHAKNRATEVATDTNDARTLKALLGALIFQNDELTKQKHDKKADDFIDMSSEDSTITNRNRQSIFVNPHMSQAPSHCIPNGMINTSDSTIDNLTRHVNTAATTGQKGGDKAQRLAQELAPTKVQLKQLETAAHALSLELFADANESGIDIETRKTGGALEQTHRVSTVTATIQEMAAWKLFLTNTDIILHW